MRAVRSRVLELDVRGLDGERRAVVLDEFLADRAGAEAGDVFGRGVRQREHRADAVRGVPHRRQARPVVGPAVHVLLVAGLEELDLAELALVVELLDVEELAGVDDGLHHHVLQAGLACTRSTIFLQSAMLVAIGHGAGDVLAGLEGRDGHPGVIGDRRVDVHGVHVRGPSAAPRKSV